MADDDQLGYNSGMTPKLTDEQRQALAASPDRAVEVQDERTREVYVLVERQRYERLTGVEPPLPFDTISNGGLPTWCNVFEGLSDEEIADIEQAILRRADLNRPAP